MVSKYIKRDFTDDVFTTEYLSDEDEYIKFEIFSFDPEFTKTYVVEKDTLTGENALRTNFKEWSCLRSEDKVNPMEISLNYSTPESGRYRIDILYEKNNNMYSGTTDKYFNSNQDLVGWYDIYVTGSKSEHKARVTTVQIKDKRNISVIESDILNKTTDVVNPPSVLWQTAREIGKTLSDLEIESKITDAVSKAESNPTRPVTSSELLFEGENNCIKRKTLFVDWDKGDYTIEVAIPHNCYVYGAIIRKELTFFGTNNDEPGSKLMFTEATFTHSEIGKASELEVKVGYDDSFECETSPSGFYMEYMDECNLYVRNNEGEVKRIFGGYVSTPLPDNTREEITIHCADRLKDGVNKYILDQLLIQNGDTEEIDYDTSNSISFEKHSDVLRYLCKLYECTLKNNVEEIQIQEEKSRKNAFTISFGKNRDIKAKNISVTGGEVTERKNSVVLRNGSSGKYKQVWKLFQVKKTPINISQFNNFHITYGLGDVKTEHKVKETASVDTADSTAGSQKFGKCGKSTDKKYVMGIGKVSAGRHGSLSENQYYKTIFKNKCPECGKEGVLVWDSGRSDSNCVHCGGYHGSKRTWNGGIPETEISCSHCCSDFDTVTGWEKDGNYSSRLTKVSSNIKSSRAEQNKLHNGEMYAIPNGKDTSVSADDIFKAIKKSVKGFKHQTGTGTTATYLEKHHVGDCWAWSDKISKELKKYKVNHKIVQYATSSSPGGTHRSVLYQNSKGKYVDFPYQEYNFPKGTWNTSGSKSARTYYHYKDGGRINQATTTGSTKRSQTTETTITNGYDKDSPFQCYIDIVYSLENSVKAKKYHIYLDFTQKANSDYALSGLNPVWVNNQSKRITLTHLIDHIRDYQGEDTNIYLQAINLIAPKIKKDTSDAKGEGSSTDWYTVDNATVDNSSRKMILYNISFSNEEGSVPGDLGAGGKCINDVMQDIIGRAGYTVSMEYGEHRCDDKINFYVNDSVTPVFTAREGDNNNILEWGNISYNPANELFNMSRCVFMKNTTTKYFYVGTKDAESILKYQEQCTLQTAGDGIGEMEAYWLARHNENYNPEQVYNFTITVAGCPAIRLGDLVKVVAHMKKLNTIKEANSFVLKYSTSEKPVIQTELGLGELAPDLQINKTLRQLRQDAKQDSTDFGKGASPVTDNSIYEWEY